MGCRGSGHVAGTQRVGACRVSGAGGKHGSRAVPRERRRHAGAYHRARAWRFSGIDVVVFVFATMDIFRRVVALIKYEQGWQVRDSVVPEVQEQL